MEETENFESLVDLFTLISIVLIISTFIFGFQRLGDPSKNIQTTLEFRDVKSGDGAVGLPEDTLVIMHTIQNNSDLVLLLQSRTPPKKIYFSGQNKSLWENLEMSKNVFLAANDIQILIDSSNNKVNANLVLTVQKWLAHNQLSATLNFNNDVKTF